MSRTVKFPDHDPRTTSRIDRMVIRRRTRAGFHLSIGDADAERAYAAYVADSVTNRPVKPMAWAWADSASEARRTIFGRRMAFLNE